MICVGYLGIGVYGTSAMLEGSCKGRDGPVSVTVSPVDPEVRPPGVSTTHSRAGTVAYRDGRLARAGVVLRVSVLARVLLRTANMCRTGTVARRQGRLDLVMACGRLEETELQQ